MNFVRITYTGRKIYRDRATGHIWQPEEERLVSEVIAKPLLKFVEFKRTAALKPAAPEQQQQQQQQQLGQEQTGTEGSEQGAALTADQSTDPSNAQKPELSEQEIAALEQQALDDKAKEVDDQREAMLITVQGMNKTALAEYGKKYDHAFDAKAKVDDMRITVNGLIHQFGVR
ncbi:MULTISPECIES: hypothetical protein [Comamonas]|uniref:hypothetical protein n=1 Tax=Comamonas TaxID=283 RepID=UPI0006229BBD|nr:MULTISPECIES: hypothetical protein [Comamonas]KKI12325.1 hypothetical protein XA67_20075 [Comamonas thiooxydans]TYK72097.1 hypothetical protein FSY45_22515 [Comamonas sp. Z1]BCX53874.1 hypothetical protein CTYAZ2_34540 [Comamonas testosteroni]